MSATFAAEPAVTSQPLTAAAPIHREVPLVRDGRAAAVLLVPPEPAYAAVADDMAARLSDALGVELPRADEEGFAPDGRTLIVLGNAFTGPVARRLYGNRLILADGAVPGPGAHELRTVPDAVGLGDVVFLGGSEPAGVVAAAEALAQRLRRGAEASLGYTVEIGLAPGAPRVVPVPTPPDDAARAAAVGSFREHFAAFRSNKLQTGMGRLTDAARGFYLTGDDAFGQLYAELLAVYADAYGTIEGEGPPTFVLNDYVAGLDQIEESAAMTDADRLRGAELLRRIVEDSMRFWEMSKPLERFTAGRLDIPWNHETHPALGIGLAAQYLKQRYPMDAADYWAEVARHVFAGQVDLDQPLEDSANYQWLVHLHTAEYVLATGELERFFDGAADQPPAFRRHLERALAAHDNLGHEATHGDAWMAFGSVAGPVLAIGASVYRDPRYGFLLERLAHPRPGSLWAFGGAPVGPPPADHVGPTLFTVAPKRAEAYGLEGFAPERALDKAVLRSGWAPADNYLMLDGLNVGQHKHLDANAIISYVANRRHWLVDMDYIRAAPAHHNTIAVTRDGVGPDQRPVSRGNAQVIAAQPFGAELVGSAGDVQRAIVQSRLHGYNGLDWQRNLFWTAGHGFIVVDELTALADGDYLTRCTWRSLGDLVLDGSRVQLTQAGERFHGNELVRIEESEGHTGVFFERPESRLEFAVDLPAGDSTAALVARGSNTGADSAWISLDGGPNLDVHFRRGEWNDAGGAPAGRPLTVPADGRHTLTVTLREGPGIAVAELLITDAEGNLHRLSAVDAIPDPVTRVDEPIQHFFIANADGAAVHLEEQFDYGHGGDAGYYADYRFAGPMTKVIRQIQSGPLRAGQRRWYANLLQTAEGDDPAGRELRRLGERAWVAGGQQPMLATLGAFEAGGLRVDAEAALLTPDGLVAVGLRGLNVAGAPVPVEPGDTTLAFDGDDAALVSRSAAVRGALNELFESAPAPEPAVSHPLDVPGFTPTAMVTRPANVTALAAADGALAAADGAVAAADGAVVAADGDLLVGDADGGVALIDPAGQEVWEQPLGGRVRSLAAVPGGGWVAGTHGGEVARLSADGKVLWTYRPEPFHGRSGSVATVFPADLDGDGAPEIIAGSDNWHYHALSSSGELLWRTDVTHAATAGAAGDLDGDGRDEILAGNEYYGPSILSPAGKRLGRQFGGPVTGAVAMVDLDGDRRPDPVVGLEDGFVHAMVPGGSSRWAVNVGGTPTAIVGLPGDGARLAIATDAHGVTFLDGDGARVAYTRLPRPVVDLALVGQRLVAPCADGTAYILTLAGEVVAGCTLPTAPTAAVAVGEDHAGVACGPWVVRVPVEGQNERTREM